MPSTRKPGGQRYMARCPNLLPSKRNVSGYAGSGSCGQVDVATTIDMLFVKPRGEVQMVLCGKTAITPDGSNEPEPFKILKRIDGALSSEKFVNNVVGTHEGIRGAHKPFEHKTRDSPSSLYKPKSLQRACNE
uniref:Uncharacterized protein n=1 Tax=Glossina austeni TaxID=7395 RepID=A0A1A9VAB6_GLOAU